MTSFFKFFLYTFTPLILLLIAQIALSANGPYYYLHVQSFRAEKSALQSIKNFQRLGLAAGIKKVKVAKLGDWYRVYIGPFSSQRQAKLTAAELKKRKIVDYAAVKKMDSKIASGVSVAPTAVTKKTKVPPAAPAPTIRQPQPATKAYKPPAKPAPKVTAPAARPQVAEKKVTAPPPKKPRKAIPKPSPATFKGGKGRNIPGGSVVAGFSHIYREINTELTERLRIDTNGGTTVSTVPIDDDKKNDFPTTLNQDTLRLTLGLTDYFEVFAEGGAAYDTLSDPGTVYGGGMRLNLFQLSRNSILPGLYGALQGSYFSGEFSEEYRSSEDGNKFERDSEWRESSAGLEIGISRSRWAVYIGGNYFDYNEETERRQLENIPPPLTSRVFEDELEQENDVGVYGGISFKLARALALSIEGRALDQESIFVALEFNF